MTEKEMLQRLLVAADQQAIAAAQQAIAADQQALAIARLEAKVDRIDRNTITIGEIVISEFNNIHPDDKRQIEQAAIEAMADPEVIEQIENLKTGKVIVVQKGNKRAPKQYSFTSAKNSFLSYFGVPLKTDYRKESYKFVARIMRQTTGVDFNGQYPSAFSQMIALVGYFYRDNYTKPINKKEVVEAALRK